VLLQPREQAILILLIAIVCGTYLILFPGPNETVGTSPSHSSSHSACNLWHRDRIFERISGKVKKDLWNPRTQGGAKNYVLKKIDKNKWFYDKVKLLLCLIH
jgi:hypothetical protein